MNLSQLLKNPPKKISNKVVIFLLVIALLGFIDSGYLTIKHFQGVIPPCSITGGCEEVLTSAYSVILGIPVSLMGMIFYLIVLVGVAHYLESKNLNILKWALLLTIPAFLASLWFVYIQVFSLGSYCIYCLGSFLTSTILFVTAMEIFASREKY
jgi:uncharacterized membrane protein